MTGLLLKLHFYLDRQVIIFLFWKYFCFLGIGKTSSATIACKELNLHYIETNASDARSKKSIELHVAGLLDNHQINNYFKDAKKQADSNIGIEHVLIMDEVDGMSGNQDRAGVSFVIFKLKLQIFFYTDCWTYSND